MYYISSVGVNTYARLCINYSSVAMKYISENILLGQFLYASSRPKRCPNPKRRGFIDHL